MSDVKPIFVLPELAQNQEWACEQGCGHVNPMLYKNVYSQTWDKENGNLIEELAEHYYTCGRKHLLMVWDNNTNDYVELPEPHYQEPQS
ncbi:hypothetical protein [Acinetobacter lwoffii]|uniref:hypothetical protein n=1 Tax=Acinetobacter lwoffii TaxID=28090 RepID=UPI003F8FE805